MKIRVNAKANTGRFRLVGTAALTAMLALLPGVAPAQTAWVNSDKQRGTPAHFNEDRTACGAPTNPYATPTPEWTRCMAGRGWKEVAATDGGPGTAAGIALRDELRMASSDLQGTVCRAWAYHALFEKTQCLGDRYTPEQLSDTNMISDEESQQFDAFDAKVRTFHRRVIELHASSFTVPEQRKQVVALLDDLYGRSYELKTALQARRISWGQYNTQRKLAGESFTPRYTALMRQAGKL